MKFKLAFAGFGVVAQGLSQLLLEKRDLLREKYNFEWEVVAISDFLKGSVMNNEGLNLEEVLSLAKEGERGLERYTSELKSFDVMEMIEKAKANTLVEVTYTDVKTGQPATDHIRAALEKGWHVVTTNKGPLINFGQELIQVAKEKNLGFGFEGVVMSGTPLISLIQKNLAASEFTEIKGILNGTTNFILTEMEKGLSYEKALKKAQELGYAEADPSGDVEGWDALGKIVILANLFMHSKVKIEDGEREGITKITLEDVERAKAEGKRWKLIAKAVKSDDKVKVSIGPEKIPLTDPLAGVSGPTNALTLQCDTLGEITIIGPGAGEKATGFALLSDLLAINRGLES